LSRQSARWSSGPPRSRVGSPKRQVAPGFAQVPRGVGAGRNPSPLSLGSFVAGNGLPLRQVYVPGAATHNVPANCAIHSAMSFGEQCPF
jgi:hypothetical protein